MKLNLGCGEDIRAGFTNIDALAGVGVDVVCDITQRLPYKDGSCDEIVAQDILEHLTREQLEQTLGEIARLLKIGGRLQVRIPSIDAIIDKFAGDHETRNLFLYGNSYRTGIWGVHKAGYTSETFITLCRLNSLSVKSFQEVDTNFEFEFEKTTDQIKVKKILFINQTLGMGGAETFNSSLFNWLKKQNIEIKSYTTNAKFNACLGNAGKIPVILDIIGNWKGLIKAIILLPYGLLCYAKIIVLDLDFDLILMSGFVEKIIVTPIAKLLNKPVVWVEFGPLASVFDKFFGLPKLLYRLVSSLPDVVIMPTRHTYQANAATTHIPTAKVRIIPCAIEDSGHSHKNAKAEKNLVVCVSRLEKGKGQDLLIEAWPRVLEKLPNAKLKIIGEGSLVLKPCKNVEVIGYVQDAVAEMAKASVVVFPSVWPLEGFGLVMLEAMSQGVPVVAFNQGTAPEIIDERCGILVDDLARGIIAMLKKPAKGGRKKFLDNFTFEIVGPKYLQAMEYALATRK